MELFDLTGKVAIVTGGNQGIGKGIARCLAKAGSDIAIAARNTDKSTKTADEIKKEFGVRALGVPTDIRQPESIANMAKKVESDFGKINILVNNAGTNIRKMPQEFAVTEWEEVLDTNLRGTFLCCQAVYPVMKRSGGKIINVGSMTSIVGSMKTLPYASSKGGILQLTRSLAVAWAPDNIQVNVLLPGWIDTPLTEGSRRDFPGLNEHVIKRTPAGRWGKPDDFEGIVILLASRASDFITGIHVLVDGGYAQSTLII